MINQRAETIISQKYIERHTSMSDKKIFDTISMSQSYWLMIGCTQSIELLGLKKVYGSNENN